MDDHLYPSVKELRALRLYVSRDTTREALCRLWMYGSEGGLTYVATEGHTMVVRRAGTHREMSPPDIAMLEPYEANEQGLCCATQVKPMVWAPLLHPASTGKLAEVYGINPDYYARVGEVERAVGARASADFKPVPCMSIKEQKKRRAELKTSAYATLVVPSDPLDAWFWSIRADAALWSGLIMPRRV